MATNGETEPHRPAVIGNAKSFWLYDSKTGFDLTHPPTPTSPSVAQQVTIKTTTSPITIDPDKSALVIIDMQNFFLSPAFGRARGAGHNALDQLVEHAIPAARKAGIRIIWLNWGLSQEEVDEMPSAVTRAFGFETEVGGEPVAVDKHGDVKFQGGDKVLEQGKAGKFYKGLGCPCGVLPDPATGKDVDAGKLLMRDQWNSGLYTPLDKMCEEGKKLGTRPDVWIHKNRMSGMWGAKTACEEFLEQKGIKTLMFTGVNTDQCVGGTYQDSFSKGYDSILLTDGSGTTSPSYSQQCIEFNAENTWGFATSCKAFAEGVESMKK